MAKLKLKRKSPHVDMTPMVDLFSLLLTFFMLTTSFRPQEAKNVDTPNSISDKQAPDKNTITVIVDKDNAVYFNMDNSGKTIDPMGKEIADTSAHYRKKLLEAMGERYSITFNPKELETFERGASFGMPIKDMRPWLNEQDANKKDLYHTGIPLDSADNQLALWIRLARVTNPTAEIVIRGDAGSDYKTIKQVMDIMQENKVSKFSLVTNLQAEEAEMEE